MSEEWLNPGPDPDMPIKQGDLLMRRNPVSDEILQVCLVITADCDITQNKYGKELAALLVIPLQMYIRNILCKRRLQSAIEKPAKNIRDMLNKWNSRRLGGETSNITLEATIDWARREDGTTIADTLNVDELEKKKFALTIDGYRNAIQAADNCKGDELDQFVAFRSCIDNKSASDCLKLFLNSINRVDLPEDIFLLPYIPQVEYGPSVVLLRDIVGVKHDAICYRAVDATSSDHFLRIGRLEPTFKYAISQSFGMLYARIGLPTEHETRCDTALEKLADYNWGHS